MSVRFLAGASAAAIALVTSGALANPQNTFSDDNTTTVESYADAYVDAYGGDAYGGDANGDADNASNNGNGGTGGAGGDAGGGDNNTAEAYSESFNRKNDAVTYQELYATNTGVTINPADDFIDDNGHFEANARVDGNTAQNAAGQIAVSANSGWSANVQQANAAAANGNITFN